VTRYGERHKARLTSERLSALRWRIGNFSCLTHKTFNVLIVAHKSPALELETAKNLQISSIYDIECIHKKLISAEREKLICYSQGERTALPS
jgi:hypothetical protein